MARLHALLGVAVLIVAAAAAADEDALKTAVSFTWSRPERSGEEVPLARKGHTATLVGKRLFIVGGCLEPQGRCLSDLAIYDTEKREWADAAAARAVGDAPPPLTGHAAAAVSLTDDEGNKHDYIYVVGGFSMDALGRSAFHADVWRLDTASLTWTRPLTRGAAPSARQGHRVVLAGDKLLLFGGYADDGVAASELFSLTVTPAEEDGRLVWARISTTGSVPPPRQGAVMGLLASRFLFVAGGYGGTKGGSLDDAYILDSAGAGKWHGAAWAVSNASSPDSAPPALQDASVATLPAGDLLLFGGCAYPGSPPTCYNKLWMLSARNTAGNTFAFRWRTLEQGGGGAPEPPSAREDSALVPVGDSTLLLFGGGIGQHSSNNELWQLQLAEKKDAPQEPVEDKPAEKKEEEEKKQDKPVEKKEEEKEEEKKQAKPAEPEQPEEDTFVVAGSFKPSAQCFGTCGYGKCQEGKGCVCDVDHYGPECKQTKPYTMEVDTIRSPTSPKGKLVVPVDSPHVTVARARVLENGLAVQRVVAVPESKKLALQTVALGKPTRAYIYDEEIFVLDPRKNVTTSVKSTEAAPAGAIQLKLASADGLYAGDVIQVGAGTPNAELNRIASIRSADAEEKDGDDDDDAAAGALLTLRATVQADATAGEGVTVVLSHTLSSAHEAGVTVARMVAGPPPYPLPLLAEPKEPACDKNCNAAGGSCVTMPFALKRCVCKAGWTGRWCQTESCPRNCTDGGECTKLDDGHVGCKCGYGRRGEACEQKIGCGALGHGCGPNGVCRDGLCKCKAGWAGVHCLTEACPNNCTSVRHGTCLRDGRTMGCHCNIGYSGADCSVKRGCGDSLFPCAHGMCVNDKCSCFKGWGGADGMCGEALCPGNCTSIELGSCEQVGGSQACVCKPGHSGADCATRDPCWNDCGGHGTCKAGAPANGSLPALGEHCACEAGWAGAYCTQRAPAECAGGCGGKGRGVCKPGGVCECAKGWRGTNCEEAEPCVRNCSDHGQCVTGTCVCDPGWDGADCGQRTRCPHDCRGHGRCLLGECACADGWTGPDCGRPLACAPSCAAHGKCVEGVCHCRGGFSGADCDIPLPCDRGTNCSGHGICHFGNCFCEPGWRGDECSEAAECPRVLGRACGPHGTCKYGRCFCEPGYKPPQCLPEVECPRGYGGHMCSNTGLCHNGTCFCAPGFSGVACQRGAHCPANCSRNGFCSHGKCQCDIGWAGFDCSTPLRCGGDGPRGCNGHGHCLRGRCYCAPGWRGFTCEAADACPRNCSDHGRCAGNMCVCDPGWTGVDCATAAACPDGCNKRGVCVLGTCACHVGFGGAACETRIPCPNNCSHHGDCIDGECLCDGDYYGADCSRGGSRKYHCPGNCTGHGLCSNGRCTCNPGWRGLDCAEAIPCPNNCSGHGLCHVGDCFCDPGWRGRSCRVVQECPHGADGKECSAHGRCAHGACFCDEGWASHDCSKFGVGGGDDEADGSEAGAGNEAGGDVQEAGGEVVLKDGCPVNAGGAVCAGHGKCNAGTHSCSCEEGWFGDACDDDATSRLLASSVAAAASGSCPHDDGGAVCAGHGQCTLGECQCEDGWFGAGCEQDTVEGPCPNSCSGNGICGKEGVYAGKCMCQPGWVGVDCSKRSQLALAASLTACADSCGAPGSHGSCQGGACACEVGWTGDACDVELCPGGCGLNEAGRSNGVCVDGRCVCDAGFGGDDCSIECPNRCSKHGTCQNVGAGWHCYCQPGYTGADCSAPAVERTGMLVSSVITASILTFVAALCCVPLVRDYLLQRERQKLLRVLRHGEGEDALAA